MSARDASELKGPADMTTQELFRLLLESVEQARAMKPEDQLLFLEARILLYQAKDSLQ